jgi:phosphoribosylaminoimidazolecarboxamide formyltransferase / IMP cyclohydrolase
MVKKLKKLALISVSDKSNIVKFTHELVKKGYGIIATGNTAKSLSSEGIEVTEVSTLTGFPEIFSGRVKTLHPLIMGGILFRKGNENDIAEAEENNINPIEIVCVNLYPFIKTASDPSSTLDQIIEKIDIGGPSLIRAAAKNYNSVSVLTDPVQYEDFLKELESGEICLNTKEKLAVAAFSHTAHYDTYISNYLEERLNTPKSHLRINLPLEKVLRYGENPHQKAALYGSFLDYFDIMHGKELSYNNILDLISAVELVEDLEPESCAIIKHNNAAGCATGRDIYDAYKKALKCDPVSAFGGIVVFNSEVGTELAIELNNIFLEVISAPSFSKEALEILYKKKDRRILRQMKTVSGEQYAYRRIPGGILYQDADNLILNEDKLQYVTERKPSKEEIEDLKFAWIVAKHTKSNAIVFAKDKATLGVGAGQMSRIDSSKIAHMKSREHGLDLNGSVAASDAFFPFADGLLEIIKCGARAVIQPGGSVRDNEVIEAANKHDISMVFTGMRHFKH